MEKINISVIQDLLKTQPKEFNGKVFNLNKQDEFKFIEDRVLDFIVLLKPNNFFNYLKELQIKPNTYDYFNPNIYFSSLKNIALKKGYLLDYVYIYSHSLGYPELYIRKIRSKPFYKIKHYLKWKKRNSILSFIEIDKTKNSYFQVAVFEELSNQFFLHWHAKYSESTIITSQSELLDLLNSKNIENQNIDLSKITNVNFSPIVTIRDNEVEVIYYIFKLYGGLSKKTKVYTKITPLKLLKENSENILEYNNPVLY